MTTLTGNRVEARQRALHRALGILGEDFRERTTPTMREEFGSLLRMFRERAGRSRNSLSHDVGVDPSYSTRIEAGHRDPPRLHIVESYARVLRLSPDERNRLLVAAGYAPHEIVMNGWSDTLQAVADVLADPFLSPEDRDAFDATVRNIAQRWRGAGTPRMTNGVHEAVR